MPVPPTDLDRLAAAGRRRLKDEPAATVEVLGTGADAVVQKTYRNRGLRLLQTWLRRSRAQREFANLQLAARRDLPCTEPLWCQAERRLGFVRSSTLVTRYVADTVPLKRVLAELPAADHAAVRRRLLLALGALLRRLHAAGLLWCTAYPRNVLVRGTAADGELLLCDLPAAVAWPGPVPAATALVDLYDAVASPSRRRELSRGERLRCLCAYAAGDRQQARSLWRRLVRRTPFGHRLRKNLLMGLHHLYPAGCRADAGRDAPTMTNVHAPMQPSKLQNYNSQRGATAYKADYHNKLHRKLSDQRERALLARYFAAVGHVDSILDLPCGHGRLAGLLHRHCRVLVEADWSFSMVALNQQDHGNEQRRYLRCSALEIPLPDRSVDAVVSFRLSHHLETQELRERHLRELFRVARRAVIVTWFSASSLKARMRQLRVVVLGGKQPKHVLPNQRVRAIAHECGFVQRATKPLFLIGSGHVLGLFARDGKR